MKCAKCLEELDKPEYILDEAYVCQYCHDLRFYKEAFSYTEKEK